MTKHSESTHAKNLTNFAALIEVLRSFGTVYGPRFLIWKSTNAVSPKAITAASAGDCVAIARSQYF